MSQVLIAPNGAEQVPGAGDQTVMKSDLKKATLQELRQQAARMKGVDFATFAAALDVEDLDDREAAILAVAQRVYREDRGCDTPIEDFLNNQLLWLMYSPTTLNDVLADVDELKSNWRDAVQIASRFYVQHPELVTGQKNQPAEGGASADTATATRAQRLAGSC